MLTTVHETFLSTHELSPMQIVDLLGRLWIMFDDVIAKYKVYKVASSKLQEILKYKRHLLITYTLCRGLAFIMRQ